MRILHGLAILPFALLLACGAPGTVILPDLGLDSSLPGPDTLGVPDATTVPDTVDAAVPDGTPRPDVASDLPIDGPTDVVVADVTLDAGPDPAACTVQPGDTVYAGTDASCAVVELAVLAGVPEPRVFVRGQLNVPGAGSDPCLAVDSAEILSRETGLVVGTLATSGGGRTGSSPYGPARIEGPIPAELTATCQGNDRFDAYRVRLTGRVDGGTFEVFCGRDDAPQTFWPPDVVVSCHSGLEHPPAAATLRSEEMGPANVVIQGSMAFPRGAGSGATVLDEQLSILYLEGSLSLGMPRNTPETLGPYSLRTLLGGQGAAGGSIYNQFEILSTDFGLDAQFCSRMSKLAPATLARVSGQTAAGAFRAELGLICNRIP